MGKIASWFDIPVTDMTRAISFYQAVTGQPLKTLEISPGKSTALFGSEGCLFQAAEDKPSHFGSRVYFNANPDISEWIERVKRAGGKILVPRTPIGNHGYFAYFEDSEGNRVGLHAEK